jgi:hypothetical protein
MARHEPPRASAAEALAGSELGRGRRRPGIATSQLGHKGYWAERVRTVVKRPKLARLRSALVAHEHQAQFAGFPEVAARAATGS